MLKAVAEHFTESYSSVNSLSSVLCDPMGRQITNSRAGVSNFTNTSVTLRLFINGLCQDCESSTFSIFDDWAIITQSQGTRRQLETLNSRGCLCPSVSDTSLTRGPTVEEFLLKFRMVVQQDTSLFVADVLEMQPIEVQARSTARCTDGPLTSFETSITIDYSVVCQGLTSSDVALLEETILNTYNDMLQSQYCDPSLRRLSNVTYVSAVNGTNDGQLSVTFFVVGTCHGCNSTIFNEVDSSSGGSVSVQTSAVVGNVTSCNCPINAIASRAPTKDEFLGAYESMLLGLSQQLVCVTTLFGAVMPTERPSSAPSILAFDCPVNLSTPLSSKVLLTLNQNATQSTVEELGQDLINAYNSFINETYSTCQRSKYREITSFTILTNYSTLIEGSRIRGRQVKGIPISTDDVVLQVDGGCAGCNATELFFNSDVVSRDDFVEYYARLVDTGLDSLVEIENMDCPSNTSIFETVIIVEYVPDGIDSESLSTDEVLRQELADIYVSTYNDLSRDYCDPFSRQLQSATIIFVGENNTFGNIPVEMSLVGTCSDCDGLDLSVYDEPVTQPVFVVNTTDSSFVNSTATLRRSLQSPALSGRFLPGSSIGSCFCPAHPIGNRAPYEAEFLDAYRQAVNDTSLSTGGQVARQLQVQTSSLGLLLSVAECQFGTEFQTGFQVRFQANETDLTDEILQSIQDALLQTIATFYQTSAAVCDPEFRHVENVEAALVPDASTRRKLQSYRERNVQQVVSPAPSSSFAPSVSARPSVFRGGPTTQTPTGPTLDSGIVDVFLYVSGVCNGCENGITLGDQTVDGRRLQQLDEWKRELQTVPESNCFCPIGSDILEPPTLNQLENLFSTNLASLNVTFQILDFGEVPVVDCTVPDNQFTTPLQYNMALEPDVTSAQIQALGDVIMSTYNSLGQDYCDPLDRTIDSIQLVQFFPSNAAVGQNQCEDYEITFQVIGTCRGCDDGTALFSSTTTVGSRRLEMNWDQYTRFSNLPFLPQEEVSSFLSITSAKHSVRRLQVASDSAAQCFCVSNVVANRAPDIEEYNNALAVALNAFQVTNICGLPSTQPVSSAPGLTPSPRPSSRPSVKPSTRPSAKPSARPSAKPSARPSTRPSASPSLSTQPSAKPSSRPSARPSVSSRPSDRPSARPSARPSSKPSSRPSTVPSAKPSPRPSSKPSSAPSAVPSLPPMYYLRFVLSWTGDNDFDISVRTPGGQLINFLQPSDPSSGGALIMDVIPSSSGSYYEEIAFGGMIPPSGTYRACAFNRKVLTVTDQFSLNVYKVSTIVATIPPTTLPEKTQQCIDYVYP